MSAKDKYEVCLMQHKLHFIYKCVPQHLKYLERTVISGFTDYVLQDSCTCIMPFNSFVFKSES